MIELSRLTLYRFNVECGSREDAEDVKYLQYVVNIHSSTFTYPTPPSINERPLQCIVCIVRLSFLHDICYTARSWWTYDRLHSPIRLNAFFFSENPGWHVCLCRRCPHLLVELSILATVNDGFLVSSIFVLTQRSIS